MIAGRKEEATFTYFSAVRQWGKVQYNSYQVAMYE